MPLGINGACRTPNWQPLPDIGDPAPGYRHRDTGALSNVGYYGYSWSSTVSSTNGMNLHFYVTWLYPSNAYYRAYGFQLRCLSE